MSGGITYAQRELLNQALDSNERQILIVNDLLKVAQIDAGKVYLKKHPVNLVQLINEVLKEQASKFKDRKQIIDFKPGSKNLMASIDRVTMRMVLENLVDNASKYTHVGKKN